jgi:hypothetical protein
MRTTEPLDIDIRPVRLPKYRAHFSGAERWLLHALMAALALKILGLALVGSAS